MIAIPSSLRVGALGGAGAPCALFAMLLIAYWAASRFASKSLGPADFQPLRVAIMFLVAAVLCSYIAAQSRHLMPDEGRSADVSLLLIGAWSGVFLVAMDMIPSRERLDVLLRRLVAGAGALATFGVIQFITHQSYLNYFNNIPGLVNQVTNFSVGDRGGFTRPPGTTLHPIEFGAVLTMCLPVALHYAMCDTARSRVRRWYPVAAIAIAIPISVSRSAVVSTIVVLGIVMPTWAPRVRRRAVGVMVGLALMLFLLVHGFLGTMIGLFTSAASDSSVTSRTGSFPLAATFVAHAPIFGRGFGTFLPAFRIFDDQYLGMVVETGLVGLVALLSLFMSGVFEGVRIYRQAISSRDRSLGISLAASAASALVSFALFDAFSFPMSAILIFLLLGCLGALDRLTRADRRLGRDQPAKPIASPMPQAPVKASV